ncbi:MAG: nucleoside phosphorylase [Candidatus Thorarchaeota archaeon]|jgi:uridine phosphorylase
MVEDKEYHIDIAPGEIPELVLLPGDPDRAKKIAMDFFDEPQEIAKKREYWSFKGKWKGVPVAVCSTGIGCPSAAIAIEELVKVGCTTFIRVGTSGAISREVVTGDIVIFTGADSKDAFYSEHPDLVADPEGTRAKWEAMRNAGVLATEMEAAALFVIGHLRGVKVGSACVVIGENIEKEQKIVGKPPLDDLVTIALDAITSFKR